MKKKKLFAERSIAVSIFTLGWFKVTFFLLADLFNLRGSDIEYNPVFFAYSVVTMDDILYVPQKLS